MDVGGLDPVLVWGFGKSVPLIWGAPVFVLGMTSETPLSDGSLKHPSVPENLG